VTGPSLPHLYSGKVREVYEVAHDRLLIVATDRVSVFDVVLPDLIPDKGRVLTALSAYWFEATADLVPNHLVSCDPTDFPESGAGVAGRAMLVRRAQPVRMECVVRGYLFGAAWREYAERGTISGIAAPTGLELASALPEPWFTPTTKAEHGHDEPLAPDQAAALVGRERYEAMRELALRLYEQGAHRAREAGLILADTKFEFGEVDGELLLIDEVLTPDSSRYWPADEYRPGTAPPAFDKQLVRDAMDATGWDHEPPPPPVPPDVIANTRARYIECYEMLTGRSFDDWYDESDA
jgi:phosphoribosylaminoimidazole-succinocarboxamide synthase